MDNRELRDRSPKRENNASMAIRSQCRNTGRGATQRLEGLGHSSLFELMQDRIHEAKAEFLQLIAAVERGENVIIARRDKPVARLVAMAKERPQRRLRFLAGMISKEALALHHQQARAGSVDRTGFR
jgi:prevent-host-death family protein